MSEKDNNDLNQEQEKQYIKIDNQLYEIVDGVEYVVSKEEALKMGFNEEE